MADRNLAEVAGWSARTGFIQDLEIAVGGYSPAPHCRLEGILKDRSRARAWRQPIEAAGLGISALNVSGNPLHPDATIARRHDSDLRNAVRAAAVLGIDRVVAMSGCPGAAPADRSAPHFAGGGWLPDLERIADWQWRERVLPYWSEMSEFASREHPGLMICFELHPGTYVYNVQTFEQVRSIGTNLGVNLDPSHFFWQSMDPLAVVDAIGDRIGHVHGKDTLVNPRQLALNGVFDNRWPSPAAEMSWNFATVGQGHDQAWWATFVQQLRAKGFRGTISIEFEDPFVPVETSVLESARLLSAVSA